MGKMRNNEKFIIIYFIISNIFLIVASATSVELVSPGILPVQVHEGEEINFTITIKDYNYNNPTTLALETGLDLSGEKPLYDFGELNQFINENRYQQKILLNLSSLPQKANIEVSISGKVPEGEIQVKCDKSDLIISKFQDKKLKLYEVLIDGKSAGIESSELVINKKESFEKIMQQIRWEELDTTKREIRKLFDKGLVTEAQNLAIEVNNIKRPDNLMLFGLLRIENNLWLNLISIGLIFFSIFIGYLIGSKRSDEEEVD